jgi:2-C-methyl-D-erythritol 4-phosphate cytidylyltransferase
VRSIFSLFFLNPFISNIASIVILIDMLNEGFRKVAENDWEVTDDVSIIELLGKPVKITKGEYTNLKITTPEDMDVAEAILEDRYEKKKTQVASQT